MVSPHISYAEQSNYKALDFVQIKFSKKITKDDSLSVVLVFINKSQIDYFARLESVQACSVESIISPRQSLAILSTIRLLL